MDSIIAMDSSSSSSSSTQTACSPEYLMQLLRDKKQLQGLPACFIHLERILDEEINRVRCSVLHVGIDTEPLLLPEPVGTVVTLQEKLTVPAKDHPDFNFVGRLLGPRGMTAKHLELETGCKILIRGRGSMRDKHKEELMRGKAKWEHLNEDLHVLITVEDTKNRAIIKLKRATEQVRKLLVPSPESEDELKKRQLMELALLNGTYRGFQTNNHQYLASGAGNGNAFSVLMMASSPQFCQAGFPPGVMPQVGSQGGLAFPILMSSEHAGAPIFLTGPPPMMSPCGGSVPSITSPGLSPPPLFPSEVCKMSLPALPAPQGVYYHHFDPRICSSTAVQMSGSSPLYEYPMTPGHHHPDDLYQSANVNMTSYVH